AVALGADADGGMIEGVAVPLAEQLARLALDLLLLAADVGHDVVDQVERGHARIAGTGAGLQGSDEAALDAESVPDRFERQDEVDRRAVGVGDDEAAVAALTLLDLDGGGVLPVDLGDE